MNNSNKAHDLKEFKIQQDLLDGLNREIDASLIRNYSMNSGDVSYSGSSFEIDEGVLEEVLKEIKSSKKISNNLSKLRVRALRGRG